MLILIAAIFDLGTDGPYYFILRVVVTLYKIDVCDEFKFELVCLLANVFYHSLNCLSIVIVIFIISADLNKVDSL